MSTTQTTIRIGDKVRDSDKVRALGIYRAPGTVINIGTSRQGRAYAEVRHADCTETVYIEMLELVQS